MAWRKPLDGFSVPPFLTPPCSAIFLHPPAPVDARDPGRSLCYFAWQVLARSILSGGALADFPLFIPCPPFRVLPLRNLTYVCSGGLADFSFRRVFKGYDYILVSFQALQISEGRSLISAITVRELHGLRESRRSCELRGLCELSG